MKSLVLYINSRMAARGGVRKWFTILDICCLKKVHFCPKSMQKSPLSPKARIKVHFLQKKQPPKSRPGYGPEQLLKTANRKQWSKDNGLRMVAKHDITFEIWKILSPFERISSSDSCKAGFLSCNAHLEVNIFSLGHVIITTIISQNTCEYSMS